MVRFHAHPPSFVKATDWRAYMNGESVTRIEFGPFDHDISRTFKNMRVLDVSSGVCVLTDAFRHKTIHFQDPSVLQVAFAMTKDWNDLVVSIDPPQEKGALFGEGTQDPETGELLFASSEANTSPILFFAPRTALKNGIQGLFSSAFAFSS